jgi:hypothetical protein
VNIGPDAPRGAVPFILPGPIADRETVAGRRVAMMKINHPLVPPTARSAQRGVPRRGPRRHGSQAYLPISATPAADMDSRRGPPFVSRVRPSFVGLPELRFVRG